MKPASPWNLLALRCVLGRGSFGTVCKVKWGDDWMVVSCSSLTWGNDPIWLINMFSDGLVQPPTRWCWGKDVSGFRWCKIKTDRINFLAGADCVEQSANGWPILPMRNWFQFGSHQPLVAEQLTPLKTNGWNLEIEKEHTSIFWSSMLIFGWIPVECFKILSRLVNNN